MDVQGTSRLIYPVGTSGTERALKKTNRELNKILEKLSTAKKINRASDDAAGLGISEVLQSNIRGFKMASRNVEDAMSAINIADGAANEVSSIMQRQRELAIQAKNSTLTDRDRQVLDTEFQALTEEINRLAGSSQFNRQALTDGTDLSSGNAQIQAGTEAGDQITLPSVDFQSTTLGLNSISIATANGAGSALSTIDNAIKNVNSQRSTIGATVNRLESTINNLAVSAVNTQAAESVLRDEDMAQGLMELTQMRLLQEGSIRAFSRFNEISQNHIMGLLG